MDRYFGACPVEHSTVNHVVLQVVLRITRSQGDIEPGGEAAAAANFLGGLAAVEAPEDFLRPVGGHNFVYALGKKVP